MNTIAELAEGNIGSVIGWPEYTSANRLPTCSFLPADRDLSRDFVEKIGPCIAYMQAHLGESLRVATLARQVNLSQSHFFALFKQATGCSPMEYFTRLRMQAAGRMLTVSGVRIKEVACSLGYHDQFHFSRVFKSVYQISPSRYRAGCAPGEVVPHSQARQVLASGSDWESRWPSPEARLAVSVPSKPTSTNT